MNMADLAETDDPLTIQKTSALNGFVTLLENYCYDSEEDVDDSDLRCMKKVVDTHSDEKYIFHLALCTHISDKQFQTLLRSEKNEAIMSSLYDDEDETNGSGLSYEKYWILVTGLGLIDECLCLIWTNPRLLIAKETTTRVIEGFSQNSQGEALSGKQCDIFLTLLVKLSRVADRKVGNFYLNRCLEFIPITMRSSGLEDHEKLALIFRVTAVAILESKNYTEPGEISEFLREWKFDSHVEYVQKGKSTKIFEAVFDTKTSDLPQNLHDHRILAALEKLLEKNVSLTLLLSDNCLKKLQVTDIGMPWLNYIGACAYVAKIAIEKNAVNMSAFSTLLETIQEWAIKKPKMQEDDFKNDDKVNDFHNFCGRLKTYCTRDLYKQDWLKKFLAFTANEVFGTLEGVEIIEEFILTGADFDHLVEFAKMAYTVDNYLLHEDKKKLVLKIFTQDAVMQGKNALVQAVFANGVSDKFRTTDFNVQLNTLTMQLTSIESETDTLKNKEYDQAITTVCFQDPMAALTKLLEQSLRTQHLRGLEFATCFFGLPYTRTDIDESRSQLPSVLMVHCFNNLVKRGTYQDSLCDCINKGIGILISKKVLTGREIFLALRYRILKVLDSNVVALSKVVGVFDILHTLVFKLCKPQETTEGNESICDRNALFKNINEFVIGLYRFFSHYTNPHTFGHAMQIRDRLVSIKQSLKEANTEQICSSLTPEMLKDLEDRELMELGILYVRCDEFRSSIEKIVCVQDFCKEMDLTKLLRNILQWVLNSCEAEWNDLTYFVIQILLKSSSKYKQISKVHVLNQLLFSSYMFSIATVEKVPDVFLHTLKFYESAFKYVNDNYGITDADNYEVFDVMVNLVHGMCEQRQKKERMDVYQKLMKGLHQVLLHLMNNVTSLITTRRDFMISNCTNLVEKISGIPQLIGTCEQSRSVILQELKKLENPSIA